MSEFEGTPGKLEVFYGDGGTILLNEDGECIAMMGGYGTNKSEDEANARLFAAAPELLEALRFVKSNAGHFLSQQTPELMSDIDAAIAKALGQ